MGPCERRRIGIRQTLGDSGMLLCDDPKELVLAWKQAAVPRRDPAGLEHVLPSSRQVRAQSEQLTEMIGHHRKMTQRPGRVVHHPVRLRAHLVLRQVTHEAFGESEVHRVHVQDVLKHWWSLFRGAGSYFVSPAGSLTTIHVRGEGVLASKRMGDGTL